MKRRRKKQKSRMEIMLTLECHWGCKDCNRGLENHYLKDSYLPLEQIERLVQYLKQNHPPIEILKINGGDPVFHPQFQEAIDIFAKEIDGFIKHITIQTAFSKDVIRKKYSFPKRVRVKCEPLDAKGFKEHHLPRFISPAEEGILAKDEPPPYGSWLTKNPCRLQRNCGRSFERWGFMGCSVEGTIGRLIGREVHSKEYKEWTDPEICKHCPVCLGKKGEREFQQRVLDGEFPWVSSVFNFSDLEAIYEEFPKTHSSW